MKNIVYEDWEYIEKEERLKEAIKHLERAKNITWIEYQDHISHGKEEFLHPMEVHSFESGFHQCDDSTYFQLIIPGILPLYDEEDKQYSLHVRDFYVERIVNSIQTKRTNIQFEEAFILIRQYFPDMKVRDFDNRSKRYIFNGLRHGKLIKDDSWNYITYMEEGRMDRDNPRTEIYVCDYNSRLKFLKNLC